MIARYWTGQVKPEEANNYTKYLQEELFPKMALLEGFQGASIMRRELSHAVDFLIISNWSSMEAIQKFAGEHLTVAVVSDKAQQMMVS
ncbi:hypothetical protein CLV24_11193 [Pontibacter ummariensis]|uniref:Antibiotic biosynthesis monooxygenase n=1 Tax=Pontibacter ummariensis TaxID=1610492 RepID=A0A239GJ74_9BACT|nr:DUF4286 family protein [Pontibacter ummariensis]PRY11298.1 hypothetical protein CLV24_11193 [Pontibacter ummariensis]SNS69199.1 hypothetical protein SAMN06296052_11193 [Pontibacter ummariensis]